jgi:hypothetical protein
MFALNIDPNNPRGNPEPAELRDLGVEMVRYTFYDNSGGDQLDPGKAQFYSQKARSFKEVGIDSLVILTYDTYPNRPAPQASDGEWNNYITRFARRAGQITQLLAPWRPAFQVWNEPDHPLREDYAPTLREEVFGRMLRQTYDTIKAIDPGFLVVTAGLATGNPGWLTTVIQSLGGTLPADRIAFHPYGQRPEPNWPHPNWFFGYVGNLLENYYRAGRGKSVWITEMGVKEEDLNNNRDQVAEFITRYYRTITSRYADKVQQLFWFCYSDGMVPPFGLVDGGGNRKPAYEAFRRAAAAAPRPPEEPIVTLPVEPPPGEPEPGTLSWPEFTSQISGLQEQLRSLERQLAQFQTEMRQLLEGQAKLQNDLRQWQTEIGKGGTPTGPPGVSPRPAPTIRNITQQLEQHPTRRYPERSTDRIERLIIHHTALPPSVGAERIASHRVDRQGWPGIGYHFFLSDDGQIQQTNALSTVSTHAGQYDPVSIGICFAGDFTAAVPTPAQLDAGARLIAWLLPQFKLTIDAVYGYKELVNTQSPGAQWDSGARWGQQLKDRVQALLQPA